MKNRRIAIVSFLLIAVLVMGIGFASLTDNLFIKGEAQFTDNIALVHGGCKNLGDVKILLYPLSLALGYGHNGGIGAFNIYAATHTSLDRNWFEGIGQAQLAALEISETVIKQSCRV